MTVSPDDRADEVSNAAVVSPRWVEWRKRTDLDDYDARFERMAASGQNVHGEADLIAGYAPGSILDAGCGTGRIAIELDRRGFAVTGVDLDADMIEAARRKAPAMTWLVLDLARMQLQSRFDLIAMPGNVMLFCRPEDRRLIVHNMAVHLLPGGLLVAGFTLERGGYTIDDWDGHCNASGLELIERFSTWDRQSFTAGGDYHVSVHRRTVAFTVHDMLADARAGLQRITAADLALAMETDPEVVVVDTRQTTDRQRDGVIPGSHHIPRTVLEWRADATSGYTNAIFRPEARIVVVCNNGYSSSLAAANLQRLGFPLATDLIGGFEAWRHAGLDLHVAPLPIPGAIDGLGP